MNAETDTVPHKSKRGRGNKGAMGVAEKTAAAAMVMAGASQRQVAEQLGRNVKTITRLMSSDEMKEARELAKSVLTEHSVQLARDWIKASNISAEAGKHEPARDALQALGVVEKPSANKKEAGKGLTVRIGVALPGLGLTPGPQQIAMPTVAVKVADDEDGANE
jgi:hypothetical protein